MPRLAEGMCERKGDWPCCGVPDSAAIGKLGGVGQQEFRRGGIERGGLVQSTCRYHSSGEVALARRVLGAARDLYGDALANMRQRLPRRHPDYVACLINAALVEAALLPPGAAVPPATVAECWRGLRAVRSAGGDASRLWMDMKRAVEHGLAASPEGHGPEAEPVAVWTLRCGVGLADLAASLRLGPDT
jgi:hypothetical protein